LNKIQSRVHLGEAVEEVKRKFPVREADNPFGQGVEPKAKVVIRTRTGKEYDFDQVVLACHADEALALLADPTEDEQRLLSVWRYQKNHAMVHTDSEIMPSSAHSWAVWNYCRERDTTKSEPVAATCFLNQALGLESREKYFLTLNRIRPVPEHHILHEAYFTHPVPTLEALRTQPELREMNGKRLTYYCGSYFGHGFHEDAVRSGMDVAQALGVQF
jgi:predicted NAD/FAD-binding protein